MIKREVRSFKVREFRVEKGEDGKDYFSGYAACYNVPSQILGDRVRFREVIKPGAFTRALKERQDIRHLINHEPSLLLGRTLAGTTQLTDDATGLHFRTLVGNRSYERDLVESMSRGDIDECSFSFSVKGTAGQHWDQDPNDRSLQLRELRDVDLGDVSIVTYPAYPNTSATVSSRAMFPDGVPEEIRSRMTGRSAGDADACECPCESCVAGNCGNCSNTECEDPNCDCSEDDELDEQMHAKLRVRLGAITAAVRSQPPAGREFRSAVKPDGTLEILIYDDIGENWWSGGGITAGNMKRMVDEAGATLSRICLRINSFGGDCFEGIAIYNMLRAQGKPIEVYVDGLAASAASVIAMSGDIVMMGASCMMMIHGAQNCVCGNADELREVAAVLDKLSNSAAQAYVERTGKGLAYIQGLLKAETWLTAEECVRDGFADGITVRNAGSQVPDEEALMAVARSYRGLLGCKKVPAQFAYSEDADKDDAQLKMRLRLAAAASE